MKLKVFFVVMAGLMASALTQGEERRGLTLGLGVVSFENVGESETFFPAIETEDKKFMFLPNIRYEYDAWSIGVDGIGWKPDSDAFLRPSVTVGYPSSKASLMGNKGWFRYGVEGSLSYSSTPAGRMGLTIGPLKYTLRQGFEERSDQTAHELALSFPVYMNRDLGLTVIGTGYAKLENTEFARTNLSYGYLLDDQDYVHTGLSAFAIFNVTERVSVLGSATLQFNDQDLTSQIPALSDPQFDVFVMFSYFFGKLPSDSSLTED